MAAGTVLGQCVRRGQRFVVMLNNQMAEEQAVGVLGHEWTHALARNYSLDRIAHCRIWTPPRSTA